MDKKNQSLLSRCGLIHPAFTESFHQPWLRTSSFSEMAHHACLATPHFADSARQPCLGTPASTGAAYRRRFGVSTFSELSAQPWHGTAVFSEPADRTKRNSRMGRVAARKISGRRKVSPKAYVYPMDDVIALNTRVGAELEGYISGARRQASASPAVAGLDDTSVSNDEKSTGTLRASLRD